MVKHELRQTLQELHETLAGAGPLDDETRRLMQTVVADLQRLAGQPGELSAADVEPVSGDLQELLLKFETEHPQISGILGRLASSLANLGI
jgi:hypothetical protein